MRNTSSRAMSVVETGPRRPTAACKVGIGVPITAQPPRKACSGVEVDTPGGSEAMALCCPSMRASAPSPVRRRTKRWALLSVRPKLVVRNSVALIEPLKIVRPRSTA
jgi:hypothetical protein